MGRGRARWLRWVLALACLAGLVWTVAALGPRRVLEVALRADPFWLLVSVPPLLGRFVIWAWKWTRMLARREPLAFGPALQILAAGSFVNLTTPTAKLAGGVVRGVLLDRRLGWGVPASYGWSMADQITNVLGNALLYVLLAAAVALAIPTPWTGLLLGSAAATLAVLVALAALRGWGWRQLERPEVERLLGRLVPARFRAGDGLRRILDPLLRVGGSTTAFAGDVTLSALAFASLCVANALVLRALGVEASLLLVSTGVVVGYFAGVLVGAWGGVGATEIAMTGLYVQFGIPAEQAAAGALLHRAIYYALILAGGGAALWRESLRRR